MIAQLGIAWESMWECRGNMGIGLILALLGSVPVAIVYSFFVEHYVAGLTAGAVKN